MRLSFTVLLLLILVPPGLTRAAETAHTRSVPTGYRPERFGYFDDAFNKIETNVDITLSQFASALAIPLDDFHNSSRQYPGFTTFRSDFAQHSLRAYAKCTKKPLNESKVIFHVVEFIILDNISNTPVRIWTSGIGLTTPEHAERDNNARYLIDVPLPPLSRAAFENLMLSPIAKRAAAWYDSSVPLQNERFAAMDIATRYSLSDNPSDLSAYYDLRIPTHYKADGAWGLVIYGGPAYDEFFPKDLREACDALNLIFATIKPSVGLGEWHEFTLMVNLISKLDEEFQFSSERTVAVGILTWGRALVMLGTLLPDRIGITVTNDLIVSPYDTASQFRAHPQFFGSLLADYVFEAGWLSKEDWSLPDLAQTKWAYGMANASNFEAFNADILPLWKAIGRDYRLIDLSRQSQRAIQHSLPYILRTVLENN